MTKNGEVGSPACLYTRSDACRLRRTAERKRIEEMARLHAVARGPVYHSMQEKCSPAAENWVNQQNNSFEMFWTWFTVMVRGRGGNSSSITSNQQFYISTANVSLSDILDVIIS